MFCMKCGTKLPTDAQFCFKCGTKVSYPDETRDASKGEANTIRSTRTEQGRTSLYQDAADAILAPLHEEVDHLLEIAREGPVTTDDVLAAKKSVESYQAVAGKPASPQNHVLYVYKEVYDAYVGFRGRWTGTEGYNKEAMRDDLVVLLTEGFSGLLGNEDIVESDAKDRILAYPGLTAYLKQVLLTELLLRDRFLGGEVDPQFRSALDQSQGREFMDEVLANVQRAYDYYLKEARRKT